MKSATERRTQLLALRDKFVAVSGECIGSQIETSFDPGRIDHVWITIRASDFGALRISLNTLSLRSKLAGFDPRVRWGIVSSSWTELPSAGIRASHGFDYARIEAETPIEYVTQERNALETILLDRAARSIFVEAWGELHLRPDLGIHQVHSRHPSFAVSNGQAGRDGAVRFYFEDKRAELLLFKFCGQP